MKRMTIHIGQAGRLVLPKLVRDRFRLGAGDALSVEVKDNAIELRPAQTAGELRRVNGVLVYTCPGVLSEEDFVDQSREERLNQALGLET